MKLEAGEGVDEADIGSGRVGGVLGRGVQQQEEAALGVVGALRGAPHDEVLTQAAEDAGILEDVADEGVGGQQLLVLQEAQQWPALLLRMAACFGKGPCKGQEGRELIKLVNG